MSSGLKNGSKQYYLDSAPKQAKAQPMSYLKPGAGVPKKSGGKPGSKRKRGK
jgi:hypothetical protein